VSVAAPHFPTRAAPLSQRRARGPCAPQARCCALLRAPHVEKRPNTPLIPD